MTPKNLFLKTHHEFESKFFPAWKEIKYVTIVMQIEMKENKMQFK